MATANRWRGGIQSGPNGAVGDAVLAQYATFDIATTTQVELFTLPQGAVVHDVVGLYSTSTQTNVTVDMGSTGDSDGLVNEYIVGTDNQTNNKVRDSARTDGVLGALVTASPLSAATTFYGINGATAGTGNLTVGVVYHIDNASAREPSAE